MWNLVSSIAFSVQSALFLWVATYVAGAVDAGLFIFLFSVAQTLNAVGNYNARDFQVSDVLEEYSFPTYYTTRWITCAVMLLGAVAYSLIKGLNATGCSVFLCLIGYRFIECVEDVYHGHVQRKGRFDVTSICMSIRIIISSLAFCIGYFLFANQVIATALLVVVSLAVYLVLIRIVKKEFCDLKPALEFKSVLKLLKDCFPVFIGAFLYTYLINAPKYAINDYLTQEIQTTYNILFMPVFVIVILSMFIYKPQLVRMSVLWNDRETGVFLRQMIIQVAIVVLFTIAVVVGGEIIGLRLLELIYGVPLMQYRSLFALLLGFGGMMAAAYYFSALITIVRKQHFILIGYLAALAVSLLFTGRLVSRFQIRGACFAYGLTAAFLMCFFLAVIVIAYVKAKREKRS